MRIAHNKYWSKSRKNLKITLHSSDFLGLSKRRSERVKKMFKLTIFTDKMEVEKKRKKGRRKEKEGAVVQDIEEGVPSSPVLEDFIPGDCLGTLM